MAHVEKPPLEEILGALLDDATARGANDGGIASRDLLDTRLMGVVTPRPSDVVREFRERLRTSPARATIISTSSRSILTISAATALRATASGR